MGLPLPPGWKAVRSPTVGAKAFLSTTGIAVMASDLMINGKRWYHVSASRKARMPSYEDLVWVKEVFFGEDQPAYQVFPKKSEHRNFHPFCLHLWACLDGDPFPDPFLERANEVDPPAESHPEAWKYILEQRAGR